MRRQSTQRLAGNLQRFCRTLRAAGVPVGADQVADAIVALAQVGVQREEDAYAALQAVLIGSAAHRNLFERVFRLYFFGSATADTKCAIPPAEGATDDVRPRFADCLADAVPGSEDTQAPADRRGGASRREHLRHKDFREMTAAEQRQAANIVRHGLRAIRPPTSRRLQLHPRGGRIDMRATMKHMQRQGGEAIELLRRHRREKARAVVLLCDISGSMSAYVRAFLLFAHALAARQSGVHAFVFGTRLTCVSRHLHVADADRALQRIAAEVSDWDGGTRIGACLRRFNQHWARRTVLADATVILLSDGLERDDRAELQRQTRQLQCSCRQLLWLNPLLRYPQFAARAAGVQALLPCVDRHLPAHNTDSLLAVCHALHGRAAGLGKRRTEAA